MTEPYVRKKIEKYLKKEGWSDNLQPLGLRSRGVDIKVKKEKPKEYGRYWLIEVKGDPGKKVKSPSGSRSSSFNSAVGQIITRMHTTRKRHKQGYHGYKYGVGFPSSFKKKVLNNLPFYVCEKLNLYVFFVNSHGKVEECGYRKIKKFQGKKSKN
ncbi:MAG: hypothetical protein KKB21_05525 [Nanoarchaeota archaeon]|nr:hypothetical protein [Nanoarchaeota archaeon]